MKKNLISILILASFIFISSIKIVVAGHEKKVTGDVVVSNISYPLRLHWFSFTAHEMGDEPLGKGFITHQRLSSDGKEVRREEHSLVLYTLVNGNEAWFAGPIGYDSSDPNPTRWFVLYVYDGGKPKEQNDLLGFTRVADENAALDILTAMSLNLTHQVVSGNLKTHLPKQ